MQKNFDLHIHTTASEDGEFPPEEIFLMAKKANLAAIAFADHDSVANIPQGLELAKKYSIEFLPAVEITTLYNNFDLHLLGYLMDFQSPDLRKTLDFIEKMRIEQSKKRVVRLQELGFEIDFKEVRRNTKGRIPTTLSIYKTLISHKKYLNDERLKPYIEGKRSASPIFNFYIDYFCKDKIAYIPCETIGTPEAIALVCKNGGVPILAHPGRTPFRLLDELVNKGLPGIEVYSSSHDRKMTEKFLHYAQQMKLLITSGTDYHGPNIKPNVPFGALIENHYEYVEALINWHRSHSL